MNKFIKIENREHHLARCTRCSQCKFVPYAKSRKYSSACASIEVGGFHRHSGGGQVILGAAIQAGYIDITPGVLDAIKTCSMCGACDISCKVNFGETVEPLESLYALREKIVREGHAPPEYQKIIEHFHSEGNEYGHPKEDRTRWSTGLKEPLKANPSADVLLHIGGHLSYETNSHADLCKVVSKLQQTGLALSYLGNDEGPTGATAFDLGYMDYAKACAENFVQQVIDLGVTTVVTFSASAIAAFRAVYPRLGVNFQAVRVLHVTEYVLELAEAGTLRLEQAQAVSGKSIAYHDSCRLGRLSEKWEREDLGFDIKHGGYSVSREPQTLRFGEHGIYDAPRKLLAAMGADVIELVRNRAASYCCGAKGGLRQASPKTADHAAKSRIDEAIDTQCNLLVSGCGNCATHLNTSASDAIEVADLLGLLANSLEVGETMNAVGENA